MKNSLMIVFFFFAGLGSAYFSVLSHQLLKQEVSVYVLYFLMFLVGIGVGMDKKIVSFFKEKKGKIFLIPLTTVLGTFAGAAIVGVLIKNLSVQDTLAVSAGFGYYSLSSVIISQMSGPALGTLALMSNIMREIITLLLTPFLARYFGKLAPIVSGGATTMDTTLPIITTVCGKEYALISIFHGIVLTVAVPFFVMLILSK